MSSVDSAPVSVLVAAVSLMVNRDAVTSIPMSCPTYEAEVVKATFGEDNVDVLGPAPSVGLDPEAEPERLLRRFGPDSVAAVYGTNHKGAIKAAVQAAAKAHLAAVQEAADQAAAAADQAAADQGAAGGDQGAAAAPRKASARAGQNAASQ